MKHLIITRFLCNENMNLGEKIFNKDILSNGLYLLKRYLIPCLENQTNKNFELIIQIHNDLYNKTNFKFDITTNLNYKILTTNQLNEYIQKTNNSNNIVITSRIDYDDVIYNKAVEDVQNAIDINCPFKIYGYLNGKVTFTQDITKLYDFFPSYSNKGIVAIFISLINITKYNCPYTIYKFDHTTLKQRIQNLYAEYNLPYNTDSYMVNTTEKLAWLYIRHENNDSQKNKLNISNTITEISNNNLLQKFNIKLI